MTHECFPSLIMSERLNPPRLEFISAIRKWYFEYLNSFLQRASECQKSSFLCFRFFVSFLEILFLSKMNFVFETWLGIILSQKLLFCPSRILNCDFITPDYVIMYNRVDSNSSKELIREIDSGDWLIFDVKKGSKLWNRQDDEHDRYKSNYVIDPLKGYHPRFLFLLEVQPPSG